mmetsp:Transcript_39138/g.92073  ORF Transcript_39138/g.92073 Transcript_39138/m.92073 type:complete len:216 (-) Transcript_39138:205-852(-)
MRMSRCRSGSIPSPESPATALPPRSICVLLSSQTLMVPSLQPAASANSLESCIRPKLTAVTGDRSSSAMSSLRHTPTSPSFGCPHCIKEAPKKTLAISFTPGFAAARLLRFCARSVIDVLLTASSEPASDFVGGGGASSFSTCVTGTLTKSTCMSSSSSSNSVVSLVEFGDAIVASLLPFRASSSDFSCGFGFSKTLAGIVARREFGDRGDPPPC